MKLKNVNLAFLVLIFLLFSSLAFYVTAEEKSTTGNSVILDSDQDGLTDAEEKLYGTDPHSPDTDGDGYSDGAEVKAGYNPLKPAPGDKLPDNQTASQNQNATPSSTDISNQAKNSSNITQALAKKISALAKNSNNSEVSNDQIDQLTNEILDSQNTSLELPKIDPKTVLVKKQNYPKNQADAKKKEDFVNYISTILYIMAINSPTPITSATDATSAITQTAKQVLLSISTQNSSSLDSLSQSGSAMLKQIQEVEVPADQVDLHIKALQYATYAQNLKDMLKSDPSDPLSNLANYSKIAAFVESLSSFATEAQTETDKYSVDYSDIQSKVKSMGADMPNLEDISNLSNSLPSLSN